ncbi:MAG: sulfotransferase [Gammaproteobacteria bacterium]|nr:sulfotransferase [Gammaproteobacteria bacterium]
MDLQNAVQRALRHLESGSPADCLRLCDEILADTPGLIEAMYLRGCAAFETGDIARSISDLDVVHINHPEHLHAAYYLGRSLRVAGKSEEALEPLQAALAEEALEIRARYELALCLTRLRRRVEAIEHYTIILQHQPGNAVVAASLSSLLERENRLDESETWAGKALQIDPANETAQVTRAILARRHEKYAEAEERFRDLIPKISKPVNRSIVWNQLGQCLEGQEQWDDAFDAFSESNQTLLRHHPGAIPDARGPHGLQTLARIEEWLRTQPLTEWNETVITGEFNPVFLVGFPRSGTTLLDRMLSAHPDIEVLEEKSLFTRLHQNWSEPGVLESLADATEAQLEDAHSIYREEMSRHRRDPKRSVVIDKLPLNLAYLFLIYRLFPKAPVIFLQRHPMDACLSCYFQTFELQASMAYFLDLELTAQYYDSVMRVASLSLAQIGNPVHRLGYEDLVADPKDQLTALLSFLALDWHDSMLEYWQQEVGGASDTPSYQQVSQRLYTRSIGRWRHYARQLESSSSYLRPWVEKFGYLEAPE